MKAFFLTVLLACSCTKGTSLTKDAMGLRVTDVQMDISHLNEVEWLVGKKKEGKVTQSFVFVVDMPEVSKKDLNYLTQLKGVDSWIMRLIVNRGSEKQDLGSLFAPFRPKKFMRGQVGGAPTNVTIKVYYAAAYPSERFRFFHCPAFGHNRRIKEMKVSGENKFFDLSIDQSTNYPEKSQQIELTPSSFNGGNSLVGEYFVEIAPYNSVTKTIHAAFKRLPRYVEIINEENIIVDSCAGERPEIQF